MNNRNKLKLKNGARLILSQVFPHPLDHYLHHVLCEYNGQFVVWVHNTTCGGCYEGGYWTTLEKASDDFFECIDKQWGPAFAYNLKSKMEVTA